MLVDEVRKAVAASAKRKGWPGKTYLGESRKTEGKSPTSAPAVSFVTSNVPATCPRVDGGGGGRTLIFLRCGSDGIEFAPALSGNRIYLMHETTRD